MRKWVLAIAMIAAVPAIGNAADAEAGKTVFNKCKACHQVDKNGVGPHLGGIVGRKAASVEGYSYSEALKKSGITWDEVAAGSEQGCSGHEDDLPGRQGRDRPREPHRISCNAEVIQPLHDKY